MFLFIWKILCFCLCGKLSVQTLYEIPLLRDFQTLPNFLTNLVFTFLCWLMLSVLYTFNFNHGCISLRISSLKERCQPLQLQHSAQTCLCNFVAMQRTPNPRPISLSFFSFFPQWSTDDMKKHDDRTYPGTKNFQGVVVEMTVLDNQGLKTLY